ncbi:phage tail assembly protein [Rhodomicrobium lacus]|uniref:phage tail assembly protein n=1 Tax=Rhodomicrobium lacus TaxID=2498452 RepID=UPI000F8E4D4A|nr:phage tail assembly protein [Rhodomicrobium lacus]
MADNLRFTLQYPLKVSGKGVSIIDLRRPKVRDIAAVEKVRAAEGDLAASIALTAAVTNLPVELVEEIDAADFASLSQVIAGFMPRATPATGEPTPQT